MMEGRVSSTMSEASASQKSEVAGQKYGLRARILIIVSLTVVLWLLLIGIIAIMVI